MAERRAEKQKKRDLKRLKAGKPLKEKEPEDDKKKKKPERKKKALYAGIKSVM